MPAMEALIGGAVIGVPPSADVIANARGALALVVGAGALAGGLAGTIANAMVKDVTYVAITDIQITQKDEKRRGRYPKDKGGYRPGNRHESRTGI